MQLTVSRIVSFDFEDFFADLRIAHILSIFFL